MRFALLFWLLNLAALLPLSAFTADDASRLRLASKSTFSGRLAVLESKGSTVIAGDQEGLVVTSLDDGLTWQQLERFTFAEDGQTEHLTLSAGGSTPTAFFIAGSPHSLRSEDGLAWEQIDVRMSSKVGNSAYKDGVLIFTVSSQNVYRSTDDGRTWTLHQNSGVLSSIDITLAFGDHFYAINETNIWRSSDGITWTPVVIPDLNDRDMHRASVSNGELFITGRDLLLMRSTDGVNFTLQDSVRPGTSFYDGDIYQRPDGRFLLVNNFGSNIIYFSSDFTSFTLVEGGDNGRSIETASGAIIYAEFGDIGRISLTEDTPTVIGDVAPLDEAENIIFAEGRFVMSQDQEIFSSLNGRNWTPWEIAPSATPIPSLEGNTLTYGNGTFVIFAETGRAAFLSTDGLTWERITTPTIEPTHVQFLNGQFIAQRRAFYWTSPDGRTWTLVDENATERARSDVFLAFKPSSGGTPDRYIRINNDEELQYSSDLITWTNVTDRTVASREAERVLYDGSRFVAIFSAITTAISEDGLSWELVNNEDPFAEILNNILVNSEFGVFTAESAILNRLTRTDSGNFVFESNLRLDAATTRYAEGNGVLLFFGREVHLSLPAEGSFDAWASENFTPTLSSSDLLPNSDPDNDGRPNLLEYAQGTNPLVSDNIAAQIEPIYNFNLTSPYAEFLTPFPATSIDLSTAVERSSTLTDDWVSANTEPIVRATDDPTMELRGSRINELPSDKEFYRMQFSLNPEPNIGQPGEFGPR